MRSEFQVHILNEEGIAKARLIADLFSNLLDVLERDCCGSTGREVSIVRTKMEEAAFFAKKAMASLPENQK